MSLFKPFTYFATSALSTVSTAIEYLVVAGGGGGGSNDRGGGGGAGGLRSGSFTPGIQTYIIKVGAGGARGVQGVTSSIDQTYVSLGGGFGACYTGTPKIGGNGGSGGGASDATGSAAMTTPGTGSYGPPIQGYPGGNGFYKASGPQVLNCGGGGGASQTGSNAVQSPTLGSAGGNGLQSAIRGTLVYYAGGGGGCREYQTGTTTAATGGLGGGGNGGFSSGTPNLNNSTAGAVNTGGGGGGSPWGGSSFGSAGGSGIVVLRYAGTAKGTGGQITTDGAFTVHSFTASGNFVYTG